MKCVIDKFKENTFFSMGFDASNKGNQKSFPITVRFFDEKKKVFVIKVFIFMKIAKRVQLQWPNKFPPELQIMS